MRFPAIFALVLIGSISSAAFDVEFPYMYSVTNGEATITGFAVNYTGPISITNTLGDCPVTLIGNGAFSSCHGVTSVAIPDSVIAIGEQAFAFCSSLTNIAIPSTVMTIGARAFTSCTMLPCVTLPASVAEIGQQAFAECAILTNIAVEAGNLAYSSLDGVLYDRGCTRLLQVPCGRLGSHAIPASTEQIEAGAFHGCSDLESIQVEAGNAWYSSVDGVLHDLDQTTLIRCPEGKRGHYVVSASVTEIETQAFYRCRGLSGVTIGNGVSGIGFSAFMGCAGLEEVSIPGGVTTISFMAFAYCSNLRTVNFGNSVRSIESYAFASCTNLGSVTFPASISSIGSHAFEYCSGLVNLYFSGDAPEGHTIFFGNVDATVYYLPGTAGWQSFYDSLPTKLWDPLISGIAFADGKVACWVTGSPPIPIALEATSDLASGHWVRLCTTNLTEIALPLNDPDGGLYRSRFYRVVGP